MKCTSGNSIWNPAVAVLHINMLAICIPGKVPMLQKQSAFITLKGHKTDFLNEVSCRLSNPPKFSYCENSQKNFIQANKIDWITKWTSKKDLGSLHKKGRYTFEIPGENSVELFLVIPSLWYNYNEHLCKFSART